MVTTRRQSGVGVEKNYAPPSSTRKKNDPTEKTEPSSSEVETTSVLDWLIFAVVITITLISHPAGLLDTTSETTVGKVWYFGWITAVSTGLGVVPFLVFPEFNKFWMGLSNAAAGGMMLAASLSLANEGIHFEEELKGSELLATIDLSNTTLRVAAGCLVGVGFIICTKAVLDAYELEDVKNSIDVTSFRKMTLIIFVMTLHSLTEGVGIGVSFGGKRGLQLGQFISLSLAVHNVPEGLAVALVLCARKVSKLRAGLWAIFTSLPQPLMAVLAFLFVESFVWVLPSGLGFAAGAMAYVAVFELIPEAVEDTSILATSIATGIAFAGMLVIQEAVRMTV